MQTSISAKNTWAYGNVLPEMQPGTPRDIIHKLTMAPSASRSGNMYEMRRYMCQMQQLSRRPE
eukprot:9916196-Karenia_brevis.AAC.1